jgi:hypothetical protein
MEEKIWFEVFTSTEEDGTETVETFDTLDEAEQYVAEHSEQDLWIDKWKLGENGNEKITI